MPTPGVDATYSGPVWGHFRSTTCPGAQPAAAAG